MKNKSLLLGVSVLVISLCILQSFCSASEGWVQWSKTYGESDSDFGISLVQTNDYGYALTGYTTYYGAGNRDFWLVKTDTSGNQLWNKTFGGSSEDVAKAIIKTGDGGYALAGYTYSFGAGEEDFWLIKTDSAGNELWNKTYGGAYNDRLNSMIQTSAGGYALAGYTNSFGAGSSDFWLIITDSSGNQLWNRTYGYAGEDVANCLIQTSDGGFAITGYTTYTKEGGDNDFWLVKTDAAGNQLWNKTYGNVDYEESLSIIQTNDDGYALVGYTYSSGAGDRDFWLVKTDSVGNELWNETYGGSKEDSATSIVQTDDGYVLAGYTYSAGSGLSDVWLVKTDSSGNQLWNKTIGDKGYDEANSLIQANDGSIVLAGYTTFPSSGLDDFLLVKVSMTEQPTLSENNLFYYIAAIVAFIVVTAISIVLIKRRKRS